MAFQRNLMPPESRYKIRKNEVKYMNWRNGYDSASKPMGRDGTNINCREGEKNSLLNSSHLHS